MTLRPYQETALTATATRFSKDINRQLWQSATGTGKTVTFSALLSWPAIREWLASFQTRERRMLVIAHREELLDQAAEKIRVAHPGLLVCVEQGERRASLHADVVVASIQTLAAVGFRRLERLLRSMVFRIVVVDEAHHAAATTYRTALSKLGFLPPEMASDVENDEAAVLTDLQSMQRALAGWDATAPKDRLLIGVTATPNRSDTVGLGCVFQEIVFSYPIRRAIDDGWLVPIVPWAVETDTSLDDVRVSRGDLQQNDLAKAVNNAKRNDLAIAAWREHAVGRSTIAFTVDVAHAHSAAEAFRSAGYRAQAISGDTPKDERRLYLRQFQDGQIDVLSNCMVLTEGTDLPRASCILHLKPTKSATLYEQMTGRGLRLFPGKENCIVLDLVDLSRRHSLQTAPSLYGLPPGLMAAGEDLDTLDDEWTALREEFASFDAAGALGSEHLTLAQLRARATRVDLWTVQPLGDFGHGRKLSWLKTDQDVFRLSYTLGDTVKESLTVQRDMLGRWEVVLTTRQRPSPMAPWGPHKQQTLGAAIMTADAAGSVAEGFVERMRPNVMRWQAVDANWKNDGPSKGQLDYLKKLRVPIPAGLTKGRASELINLAKSRRPR